MAGTPYLIGSHTQASGGSTTITVAITTTSGLGDSIIVGIGTTAVASAPTAVIDTQGNSYSEIITEGTTTSNSVWQADGCSVLTAGTDKITVTMGGTAASGIIIVGDNNVGLAGPPEDIASAAYATSTSPSAASGTLSQTYEHLIAFIAYPGAGGSATWGSPFSSNVLTSVEDSGNAIRLTAAFDDVTATTSVTASATITSSAWSIAVVSNEVSQLQILNASLPNGIQNIAYTTTLTSGGGVGTITWSITAGSLPTGLSLAGAVISGTPTVPGTYTFTVQAAAASYGPTTTQQFTVVINTAQVSGAPLQTLYGNLLSAQDSQFTAAGYTWAAYTNASSITSTTRNSLTGAQCGYWTATAAGTTGIETGAYAVTPNASYVVSGFIQPMGGVRTVYFGVNWYNSSGSLIATAGGPNQQASGTLSSSAVWTPDVQLVTSPANAATAKVVAWVASGGGGATVAAGELNFIDAVFFAQSVAQISVDFCNPSFGANATSGFTGGGTFMDVTPWVRKDLGISYSRGRQDAISEIQAGSLSFSLQNDNGTFTRFATSSPLNFIGTGGVPSLGCRVQLNMSDQAGNWYTRWDGPVSEIDYTFDNTGDTSIAQVSATDIFAALNRQSPLQSWTYQQILANNPQYFWPLNDYDTTNSYYNTSGDINETVNVATGGFGLASEVSGNNGPPLRLVNADNTAVATISWASTTAGVETLADAVVSAEADGSEYWVAGSNQPTSALRGLDSGGVGPYTTTLPNIYLTPVVTAESAPNTYIGNNGYQLICELPGGDVFPTHLATYNWTFELFFTADPSVNSTYLAEDTGPFICWGLGSSRNAYNIAAGIFPGGPVSGKAATTFQVNTYNQPPAFAIRNNSGLSVPSPVQSLSTTFVPDDAGCPHHLIVQIQGSSSGGTVTAYLDGVQIGSSFSLPVHQSFDTVNLGGPHGCSGSWFGALSCAAVYDYLLSASQITEDCMLGQYGMWEQTTDNCIAQLATYAGIPAFWTNLSASGYGLTMTEYLDITDTNALANMQYYEQSENGILFVNASGQLSFYTRDWKMGYPGPDLLLPPDTFDGAMGYELVDQYQCNESAIATLTWPAGASFADTASQASYGVYATNPIGSPNQLPLITWNRGFGALGLPTYYYWNDPNLIDLCSWQAQYAAQPWLVPGQLVIDLLTLDSQTGLTISDFYNLEIGNMVAPSGTLPASFPTASLSTQWFIEGVSETLNQSTRTISYYTSPAEIQRAWQPGDQTYGVLGSTAQVGISTADTSTPEADGKDVSHDGGPPYWPPAFSQSMNSNERQAYLAGPANYGPIPGMPTLNNNGSFFEGSTAGWTTYSGSVSATASPPGGCPTVYAGEFVNGGVTQGNVAEVSGVANMIPVTTGKQYYASAYIYTTSASGSVNIGFDWESAGGVFQSSAYENVPVAANQWTQVSSGGITCPEPPGMLNQNPDFEVNTSPWTALNSSTISASASWAYSGSQSAMFTGNGSTATPGMTSEYVSVSASTQYTFGATWYSPQGWTSSTVEISITWYTSAHVLISTSSSSTSALAAGTELSQSVTATSPSNAVYALLKVFANGTPAATVEFFVDLAGIVAGATAPVPLALAGALLFCPDSTAYTLYFTQVASQQGAGGFVGATDLRGLATSMATLLNPPMCVVGAQQAGTSNEGEVANPTIYFDTVYVDTQGGFGLVPGYPNWYCVTVPGFYEIDAAVPNGSVHSNYADMTWIIVAEEAAQGLNSTLGATPLLNGRYVCPVGETRRFTGTDAASYYNIGAPSTRMYLGVGDMVAIGYQQNYAGNISTVTADTGAWFSLRWTGYSNDGDDRAEVCTLINGGTITDPAPLPSTGSKSFLSTASYTYLGSGAKTGAHNKIPAYTNNLTVQGGTNNSTGSRYSQVIFNWSYIRSQLSAYTVTGATLTCTNHFCANGTNATMAIGTAYNVTKLNCGASTWTPAYSGSAANCVRSITHASFNKGATAIIQLPASIVDYIINGGPSTITQGTGYPSAIFVGNDSTETEVYNATWNGAPGTWKLTFTYIV